MTLDLHSAPMEDIQTDTELMFSESASRFIITIDPNKAKEFEKCMGDTPFGRIGVVNEDPNIIITGIHGETILDEDIEILKSSWQNALNNPKL